MAGATADRAVLATLGRSGPLSRAELSRELQISPATVTQVVRRMLDRGVVEELSHAASTGGRPAQLVGIVAGAARAIGVKVAADHLTVVESRLDGSIIDSSTTDFVAVGAVAAGRLAARLEPIVNRAGADALLGVGIGVPGVVDAPHEGRVNSPVLEWDGLDLGHQLRAAFGVPVLVENNVRALAVAEQLFGRGRHHRHFVVLTIGSGIGAAAVTDGVAARGAHGAAGEIGHVRVPGAQVVCRCGRSGCLDAVIGEHALIATANAAGLPNVRDIAQLHDHATRGEHIARTAFAQAGTVLARAVTGLIAGTDPELIIVLGEGAVGWSHWHDAFTRELDAALAPPVAPVQVEVEYWDDARWAQGAAALVLAIPFRATASGSQTAPVLARLTPQVSG